MPSGVMWETVATTPNRFEVGTWPNTLLSLVDPYPTTLSDFRGPTAIGDATWSFEWDVTIGAGKTFIISKDKRLDSPVPLPASVWMGAILLGGIGVTSIRRRLAA
jgi:hypothetical protein